MIRKKGVPIIGCECASSSEAALRATDLRHGERIFRYVVWDRLADYEACGWLVVADLGEVHGRYRVLCEWLCGCPCVEPKLSE